MRDNGIRIVKVAATPSTLSGGYDYTHSYLYGYMLDLRRKTAVLMRQSRRGATSGTLKAVYGKRDWSTSPSRSGPITTS